MTTAASPDQSPLSGRFSPAAFPHFRHPAGCPSQALTTMALHATYWLTILLSAALVFSVQPLIAKHLLPLLGGTPAVWNTCMVFFQTSLLAGYTYAHVTTRWIGGRRQALLHLPLLVLAAAAPMFQLPAAWPPPAEGLQVGWLLAVLAAMVGLPFFALAATAPLLQKWLSETDHSQAHDPYFLYAASNLGSMLALLGYPLVIEPWLPLAAQARGWRFLYWVFAALMVACGAALWRRAGTGSRAEPRGTNSDGKNSANSDGKNSTNSDGKNSTNSTSTNSNRARRSDTARGSTAPRGWQRRLSWVVWSLLPVSWLMSVTTYVTTDIAPMPLLWIVPLALYLLTFIIAFAARPWFSPQLAARILPVGILWLVASTIFQGVWQLLPLHLGVFFLGALVCHGRLAADRPDPESLTEFYFWISLGGVAGGLFNALLAPLLFPWLLEYPLTVALACGWGLSRLPQQAPSRQASLGLLLAVATGVAAMTSSMAFRGTLPQVVSVLIGLPLLLALFFANRPRWFALVVAVVLVIEKVEPPVAGTTLFTGRSFFGINRVVADPSGSQHRLIHGTTVHGIQAFDPADPERRRQPLVYYHRDGPLGEVFEVANHRPLEAVGVVGLGAGAAICYHQADQHFTFFEIDPVVRKIAETPQWFSYLAEAPPGSYSIVLGDGRLQLAAAPDASFDVLLFDAFSSDAIPVHLLTREALATYLRKLTPDGCCVFHITNTHVDLEPVLARLAADAQVSGWVRHDLELTDEQFEAGRAPASYVVLTRHEATARELTARGNWRPLRGGDSALWTDEYSHVLGALKWLPHAFRSKRAATGEPAN